MPAWVVARGQTIAELRGWSPFTALQVPYNVIDRDIERDHCAVPAVPDTG